MKPLRNIVMAALFATGLPLQAADGDLLARVRVALDDATLLADIDEDRRASLRTRLDELDSSVEVSRITYDSDGLKVQGYLAEPKGEEKRPCVIFNRGGNRDFGALTDLRAALLFGDLAREGYVVVGSQYRGAGGSEGLEEFGGAEIEDVLNLIPLLEELPRADAERLGMFGWSRGGMMTYLALTRTDRIRAAVVGAGVSDSFAMVTHRPEMEEHVYSELVPNWSENREQALIARSAIRWPERRHRDTPILILHGTGDWRVDPRQSLRMADALFEIRHPFRLMVFEGGNHGLSEYGQEVDDAVAAFFDRYVRDGESWPSLEPHGR